MQVKSGPIRGIKEVQAFLRTMPRGTIKLAIEAFTTYVIGDARHGLKHPPPYKHVSRKTAYGQTFQSEKQQRWYWANGGPDMIGNHRTGETEDGWYFRPTNDGYGATIINDKEGAYWTQDDKGQAAQPALVGWRKVSDVVRTNIKGGIRSATAAVNRWLKAKGK